MTYEEWYEEVNTAIIEKTGKDADQAGEYPFMFDYELCMTPTHTANLFCDWLKLIG